MGYPTFRTVLQRFISSRQMLPGDWANGISDALFSAQSIVAVGAATQAAATQLNAAAVELLAGAAAAVKLPQSYPGAEVTILNNSGNAQQVFGTGTDVVQTTGTTYAAAATGVVLASLACSVYRCVKTGFWQRITTA
jgi:hypothetical protein